MMNCLCYALENVTRRTAIYSADKIEKELQYPGEIKVSVIRETRVIEYAK